MRSLDIEYLLMLQGLREGLGGALDSFFEAISYFVVSPYVFLIMAGIYWCVNKRAGYLIFFNVSGSYVVNQALKNSCCIYRPWIRDPRVVPAGDSITTATGYSFPSGHTQMAVSQMGSVAMWQRRRKWLVALCVAFALLVMFSRNYLGVHTPQDVLASCALCCASMFIIGRIIKWADGDGKRDWIVLGVGLALCAAFLIYVTYKPYPMDYDAAGALLVDPYAMTTDCYNSAGQFVGFLVGWALERRFLRFDEKGSVAARIARFVVGSLPLLAFAKLCGKPLVAALGAHWGNFAFYLFIALYIVLIYPLAFTLARRARRASGRTGADARA